MSTLAAAITMLTNDIPHGCTKTTCDVHHGVFKKTKKTHIFIINILKVITGHDYRTCVNYALKNSMIKKL